MGSYLVPTRQENSKAVQSQVGTAMYTVYSTLLIYVIRWYEWLDPSIKKVEWSKVSSMDF
jgi:hypothetical protein